MKKQIKVEIELSDEYVEKWENDYLRYHLNLYNDLNKAQETLKSNPIEKAIAQDIEVYLMNSVSGIIRCNVEPFYIVNKV